ncbi:HEXXH motif domain-containing protein [Actinoplanes subglobosus]|uniref:HEXXH motif domain-containing protein n=1 Tax=Actinoplanes subglobosus TaxID=1547892 RepID=A0ABV8J6T2_9ACTN
MMEYHRITDGRFADLASGLGGPAAVDDLAGARHSKNLLLLGYVVEAWRGDEARQVTDVLIAADRHRPEAIAEVISDPFVGAWLAATARRIRGLESSDIPLDDDLAQLGALAAAAAVRAGIDAETHTRTRGGVVTLPTIGTARPGADGAAVVRVSGDRIAVTTGGVTVGSGDQDWQPVRLLTARRDDLAVAVPLEDANPYRGCYHAPPAERLGTSDVRRWQELFTAAWELLAALLPERATELATGLRAVVPLVTEDVGEARSGTARDAFGAVGTTLPRSGADFVVTLVHEFQHSKLSALLDLMSLHVPGGPERHFAPWREDPRPTGGLVQGVYAFLGVADTWRALRAVSGLEREATREFAFARLQLDVGLRALEQSRELTARGREFVGHLRAPVDRLMGEAVPAAVAAEAAELLAQRRHAWGRYSRVVTSPRSSSR